MKKRLMVFCDSYLPGLGGGGMWAIRNLAIRLGDSYEFFIVTRDCDGKHDNTPYVKIARNKWTKRPEGFVYYASPSHVKSAKFAQLVDEIAPDAIYMNSVFSKVCIKFLIARRRFLNFGLPVVLAPCGELPAAALKIKRFRKRIFFTLAKATGHFENLIWKASSEAEKSDILQFAPANARIVVAPELTPETILPDFRIEEKPRKEIGHVRLVYLSRVSPKKNLHFLLELLRSIDSGSISLDVIGSPDDPHYLKKCQRIAADLPSNVNVDFRGGVRYETVLEFARNGHFMVLPTRNENFGYVVIEALAAGCPVILSDQLDWEGVTKNNAGWRIPLNDRNRWLRQLRICISMSNEDYSKMSFSARDFALKYLNADEPTAAIRSVFDSVMAGRVHA